MSNDLYSKNGLRFKENMKNRPTIRGLNIGNFMIHVDDMHLVINKNDIDDLIVLLQEVKNRDYNIKDDQNV